MISFELLEPGDEGKDLVSLFSDVLDVGVLEVDLDGFELGELEDEDGKICLCQGVPLRDATSSVEE